MIVSTEQRDREFPIGKNPSGTYIFCSWQCVCVSVVESNEL